MEITVTVTQEIYDCIDRGLRDDLTPDQWLQEAIDGKYAACHKRERPLEVSEAENLALRSRIAVLEKSQE